MCVVVVFIKKKVKKKTAKKKDSPLWFFAWLLGCGGWKCEHWNQFQYLLFSWTRGGMAMCTLEILVRNKISAQNVLGVSKQKGFLLVLEKQITFNSNICLLDFRCQECLCVYVDTGFRKKRSNTTTKSNKQQQNSKDKRSGNQNS